MIRVAKAEYPKDLVKGKLLKLNFRHLEFVLEGIKANTTKVKHMRQYLLAALFNVPSTMAPYYRAAVNHDMYTDGKT